MQLHVCTCTIVQIYAHNYGIRTKNSKTGSPGGVIRAWHTLQRYKSAGEYGCVREQPLGSYADVNIIYGVGELLYVNQVDQSKKAYCGQPFRACWLSSAQSSILYSGIHMGLYTQGFLSLASQTLSGRGESLVTFL